MFKAICDRCKVDCDKNAIFLNVEHISNYATGNSDIGSGTIGKVEREYKVCICQKCNKELGLPNPYKDKIEFKNIVWE